MTDSDEGNTADPAAEGGAPESAQPDASTAPPTIEELNAELKGIEVRELIAQGGMGSVFKAYQPNLDRTVAIKVLPRHTSTDPEWAEHFRTEARAMAKLHHTNIVTVHDFGETASGLIYFVMEYVEGGTLFNILHEQDVSEKNAIAIVSQVCDALKYAHDHGVVHRDIKTANIMLHDLDGLVKVADFGLAKLQHDAMAGLGDSNYGTPEYAPPEVTDPNATIDHRADIYSTGVLLYELLVGHPPDPNEVFVPPSEKVEGVDPRLDKVIIHAMQLDPENRYQDAAAFRSALDDVRTGAGLLPPPDARPAAPQRPGNPIPQHASGSGGLPIAKIAAVVLAVVIGWALIKSTQKGEDAGGGDPGIARNEPPSEAPKPEVENPDPPAPGPNPPNPPVENDPGTETKVNPELADIFESGNKPPPPKVDPVPVEPVPVEPVEPELTAEQKKMQELEATMLETYAKEVGDKFTNGVKTLTDKYIAALKNLEEARADAADLDGVLAAQKEARRVQEEGGHPPPPGPDVPDSVASMQKTYSDTLKKLEAEHDDEASAFLRSYDIRLDRAQSNLTKQGKIEDAIHLKNFRDELKKQFDSKGEKLRNGKRLTFAMAAPPRRPPRTPSVARSPDRDPGNPGSPAGSNNAAPSSPTTSSSAHFPLERKGAPGTIIAVERKEGTGMPLDKNVLPIGMGNVVDIETSNSGSSSTERLAGHGLALLSNGKVEAWGSNTHGQIDVPAGLADVVDIAAMQKASAALKADGTVVVWGSNDFGETDIPADLGRVIAIEAGERHCLALKPNGTVIAWGEDAAGQCGVPRRRFFRTVAAASRHSVGVTRNGDIVCWGAHDRGQLDAPDNAAKPGIIDAAGNYGIVLFDSGEIAMWGDFSRAIPLAGKPVDVRAGHWWSDHGRTAAIKLDSGTWEIFGNETRLQMENCSDIAFWRSYIIGIRP